MEIIELLLLFIIAIEGGVLIYNKKEIPKKENPRREITGTFKDPLGYKTNTRGQLKPIIPGGKMIDDDEV